MRLTQNTTVRTSDRQGFTLIELLIVVVIIGILAAVAIPKFSNTKEKAYVASMKSDLKNLVSTQESYYADNNAYGDKTALIDPAKPYKYAVSQGTTITAIAGDATGWSAEITNPSVSGAQKTCNVFGGGPTGAAATNKGNATQDGVPQCGPVTP